MNLHPVIWHEHRLPVNRPWSPQDEARLVAMIKLGLPIERVARSLRRTVNATRIRRLTVLGPQYRNTTKGKDE
jgi:hypothetical protein